MITITWRDLEDQREQQRKHAFARCQWIVETCASLPWAKHFKPCWEPATVCTVDGGIPHETFCNTHGAEKEKQGVVIYLIEMASWYGGQAFRKATFRRTA